jgi:hypothetical protein
MIKEVTWVDGSGEVRRSANPSPEFKGLSAGLGLAGIVTEVTLQLTPPSDTKLVTRYLSNDTTLYDDIGKMLKVGALGFGVGGGHRARAVVGVGRGRVLHRLRMARSCMPFHLLTPLPPPMFGPPPPRSTRRTCWCPGEWM